MIRIVLLVYLLSIFSANSKQLIPSDLPHNNQINKSLSNTIDSITKDQKNLIKHRLELLNKKTPFDLIYNHKSAEFIDRYLGVDKPLIERMQQLKKLYFPIFETILDQYNLPLEFKYLAIVESSLNTRATSPSGAKGLWQFMYLTGKHYNLNVTSYIDERQDPYKSTEAACKYFSELYEMFGDWNLVLAAYNGGPGYIQRKINSVGSYNFWDLYPYLRKETRNYVPKFIAMNYVMSYSNEHSILPTNMKKITYDVDTIKLKAQVTFNILAKITCVDSAIISFLNPTFKMNIIPSGYTITLPKYAKEDFLNNEKSNYAFVEAVDNKEILIDEERVEYNVLKGDYLGKIAEKYSVHIYEIKHWNNLQSTNLDIGQKLIIYVKKSKPNFTPNISKGFKEYIVQKGDTLWEIAQRLKGVSVWKIKSLNNMDSDNLRPGTKLILPII